MTSRKKRMALGGAVSLTLALLFLLALAPLSLEVRRVVAALIPLLWLAVGGAWAVCRFGKVAALVLVALVLILGGMVGYAYWKDEPNRRIVAQIKELGASYVGTTGKLLTGEVEYVY